MSLEILIFTIFNGVLYGMFLFMLSCGLTLIFGMMGVLNFAHASFFMLGAYFAYQISSFIGYWPALLIAPILVAILGGPLKNMFGGYTNMDTLLSYYSHLDYFIFSKS